jgi:hypothetical protein
LIGKSDSTRLTFLATAEHACVIGSSNPCGLFAALITVSCGTASRTAMRMPPRRG